MLDLHLDRNLAFTLLLYGGLGLIFGDLPYFYELVTTATYEIVLHWVQEGEWACMTETFSYFLLFFPVPNIYVAIVTPENNEIFPELLDGEHRVVWFNLFHLHIQNILQIPDFHSTIPRASGQPIFLRQEDSSWNLRGMSTQAGHKIITLHIPHTNITLILSFWNGYKVPLLSSNEANCLTMRNNNFLVINTMGLEIILIDEQFG